MRRNKGSKTAKLDRKLFFQIGNGELRITGNAINFMLYTISYVAKDGRIYCERQQILNDLAMQHKTLDRVINELKLHGLISEKEGYIYSHFHVLSNGEKDDKSYMKNIKALTNNEILFSNIKKKRFFLYVASFARIGTPKLVSVEALYSNKYHSGVNYIESYQEIAEILFEFVQKGYFVVYINGKRYDEGSTDFAEAFHSYCGFDKVSGKRRMSKIKKHKIAIQINEKIEAEVLANQSSSEEFKYFAVQNNICHELMRPETIPFFINIQNELFDWFGTIGVELYRHALSTYFSLEEENVLYHDLMASKTETKAINTMVDFYLIKELQDIILKALTEESTDDSINQYFMDENHLSELVRYFIQKSSDNHKVLLDAELEKHGIQLNQLLKKPSNHSIIDNQWLLLNNHIKDIYSHIHLDIENVDENRHKEIIREWAKEGILAKKEWIKQSVQQLKEKTFLLIRRDRINTPTTSSAANLFAKDDKERYAGKKRKQRERFLEKAIQVVTEMDDIVVDF